MDEKLCEQIALFRYGVISELVTRALAPGEKERLIAAIAEKPWPIPGTRRTRIGRSTVRTWLLQHEVFGFDGLKPAARRDSGCSRALPEAVQQLLLRLRAERPRASVHSLIRAVQLAGCLEPGQRLATTTVYRFLAAQDRPSVSGPSTEPDALAFTYPHAGDLWTSDLLHGPRLLTPGHRGGQKTYLYAFLDDATRLVPFAAFYDAENAACFHDALKQALLRRGIPRRLYCDNGATFRTHHLQVLCATLQIALIHSRPYKPRGRGKIERFFRHVRSAFLPHLDPHMLTDLAALNRVFWAWLEAEYHQTPHRGLDGCTPLDRFHQEHDLVRSAPEQLEALMRMRVQRKIARDRTLRLDGRLFEAPDGYAGETVEVLYDPYDLTRPVHFHRRGCREEVRLRPLDLNANATRYRPQREQQPEPTPAPTGISYLDLLAQSFYPKKEKP